MTKFFSIYANPNNLRLPQRFFLSPTFPVPSASSAVKPIRCADSAGAGPPASFSSVLLRHAVILSPDEFCRDEESLCSSRVSAASTRSCLPCSAGAGPPASFSFPVFQHPARTAEIPRARRDPCESAHHQRRRNDRCNRTGKQSRHNRRNHNCRTPPQRHRHQQFPLPDHLELPGLLCLALISVPHSGSPLKKSFHPEL